MTTPSPFSLDGKKILVTGASSGIGRATAIACSQQGAQLVITGRNESRLQETFHSLYGEEHQSFICELTDRNSVEVLVNQIEKLDGVVYCAGTQETCITKMLTESVIHQLMDTNFTSVALLNALLLQKKKISKYASIVIISSAAARYISEVGNAAYSASKGALSAFGRVLAAELSPRGIRVNMVAPAMVRTAIMDKFDVGMEEFEADEERYPLGYGTPDDVANSIVFLLSPASKWITGTELLLDGGLTLH